MIDYSQSALRLASAAAAGGGGGACAPVRGGLSSLASAAACSISPVDTSLEDPDPSADHAVVVCDSTARNRYQHGMYAAECGPRDTAQVRAICLIEAARNADFPRPTLHWRIVLITRASSRGGTSALFDLLRNAVQRAVHRRLGL